MPKMKTHKGLKKRLRLTRKGKVVRGKANRSHLMSGMSGKRKRQLRRKGTVSTKARAKGYRRLLKD